jgi:GTP-binding protein Era
VLEERSTAKAAATVRRYDDIYVRRRFTPVGRVFGPGLSGTPFDGVAPHLRQTRRHADAANPAAVGGSRSNVQYDAADAPRTTASEGTTSSSASDGGISNHSHIRGRTVDTIVVEDGTTTNIAGPSDGLAGSGGAATAGMTAEALRAARLERQQKLNAQRRREDLPSARQPEQPHVVKVALLGPPNAGKSTLMNTVVTSHVSAVSKTPGTTARWVKGVTAVHDTQLVLLDTPGLFLHPTSKERNRVTHLPQAQVAWDSLYSADVALCTVKAGLGFLESHHRHLVLEVARRARARDVPLILCLTKMDVVQTARHRALYASLRADIDAVGVHFAHTVETAAVDMKGIIELKDLLATYGRPRPWQHHRRETSNQNEAERASEMLREALFQELPSDVAHQISHKIVGWTVKEPPEVKARVTEVHVELFVERPPLVAVFLGRVEAIGRTLTARMQQLMKKRYYFTFQPFVSPSGRVRS